jgi:hypothetical protein
MSANVTPIFPKVPRVDVVQFVNADGTTAKALVTPSTDGTRIANAVVTSDDTAAVTLVLSILKSAVTYKIGECVVPIGAGTNGTTAAKALFDSVQTPYLEPDGSLALPSGAVLQVAPKVAVTATKTLSVVTFGGDY